MSMAIQEAMHGVKTVRLEEAEAKESRFVTQI
jgi:hypothetical protein